MANKWDADPATNLSRRLGKSAHELAITTGNASCPDIWELDNGDIAIIGTSAIDPNGTLLDFDVREVETSRAIIEHARKIVLVADSSKFSRSAPVRIAHLSEIDVFVTDRLPNLAIAEMCQRCEVKVIETGGPTEAEAVEPREPSAQTKF